MAALWAAGPEPIIRRRVWVGILGGGEVKRGRGRGWLRERVVAARVKGRVERRVEGRRRKEEENRLVVRGGMVEGFVGGQ